MRPNGRLYLPGLESTLLQKTHLAGFLLEVRGQLGAEFFLANLPCHGRPVLVAVGQDFVDETCFELALFEFEPDSNRAFTLVDAGLDEVFYEATIALQVLGSQPIHRDSRRLGVEPQVFQFGLEFEAAVFAACKIVHGLLARLDWIAEGIDLFRIEEVFVQFVD